MKIKINRGLENKFYKIVVVTAGILLAVFFTSKLWMYDDNPVMQTPFGADINGLDQTVIQLNTWEYNPKNELMEVNLSLEHRGDDVIRPTFSFTARERDTTEEYPVEIVYYDERNVVIQIKEVLEDFRTVGLYVKEHRDEKILENEYLDLISNESGSMNQDGTDEVEIPEYEPDEHIIVGDYRTIQVNNLLDLKDEDEYELENVEREITRTEKEIDLIYDERIPLQEELIGVMKSEVNVTENEMNYQTESEKEETEKSIESKNNSMEKSLEEIEKYKEQAKELEEQKKQLEKKLNDLKELSEGKDLKDDESNKVQDEEVEKKSEDN